MKHRRLRESFLFPIKVFLMVHQHRHSLNLSQSLHMDLTHILYTFHCSYGFTAH